MGNITDIIILISFLVEVFLLVKLEKTLWGTYYTPLIILMLPYTVVLLITVSLPESLGFVSFYYPSILVWSVGLLVFFIPSAILGLIYRMFQKTDVVFCNPVSFRPIIVIGSVLLIMSFLYLMTRSLSSFDVIGSDEFAEATLSGGLWGHVRHALLGLLILFLFFFQKKIIFYFLIIGILMVSIIYQVKSWILIPVFAGIIMRLYTEKTKLKLKYLFYILLGSVGMFFLSYYLIFVVAVEGKEFNIEVADFIYKHFFHYLISGTAGLSIDIQNGILENPSASRIFAPFLNIISLITKDDLVSPINPVYLYSGWTGTNVRTFFGTLYVNLGTIGSIFFVFFFSMTLYAVLLWMKNKGNVWALAFYSLMCALLFMGWFEFYFFHLIVIEVPVIIYLYIIILYKIKWKVNTSHKL